MLIDVSRPVGNGELVYPGDPPTRLELLRHGDRDGYALSRLEGSVHMGTHIESCAHFHSRGGWIGHLPLQDFVRRAHVVESPGTGAVSVPEELFAVLGEGDAVLFKTGNSELPRDAYASEHAYLDLDLAGKLLHAGVQLFGMDYLSIERSDDPAYPVHDLILGVSAYILEDIDLSQVRPGIYRLYCFPIRLEAEAAPCRAVLETP